MTRAAATLATVVAVIAVARAPRADVWKRAIEGPNLQRQAYDNYMARGDDAATSAAVRSVSLPQVRHDLALAIDSYERAARIDPKAAEPYFRIGTVLHAFYFDCLALLSPAPPTCAPNIPSDDQARRIVAAWDAFEARAPLDPRVNQIRLERAILRTKLIDTNPGDRKLLEGARDDYRAIVERSDGLTRKSSYLVLGNLAETYMMLGELDEAIEIYRQAIRAGGTTSTIYGLAVALDRNDSGSLAASIIRDLGVEQSEQFRAEFAEHEVFYVPAGEEHYYFALIEEAFGDTAEAIREWKLFLDSGAHPQFQPRAREHLDALSGKHPVRWRPRDPGSR